MKHRIKEIRKTLSLTLEKFSERLGVSRAAISNIENGNRNVTEQMFKSICREFNVNPDWLRNGIGEMFIALDSDEEFDILIGELLADQSSGLDVEFKKEFITALLKLDLEQWVLIKNFIDSFTKK